MHRKVWVSFLLVCVSGWLYGQSGRILQNLPPSVKWYQIKTPHFKIIYPEGFTEQGQRMANTMEHIYQPAANSLGRVPKKNFPLILQNQTAIANGFVTVGPFRSEFYTMAPQRANFLGNNDWLDLLAIHEYRHVVQFDRSRTGFTGFIRNLFGEYSMAALAFTSVPSWFWEGDAVGVETAMTTTGRGRIPKFSAAFRANLLERGPYNYNKQYLRSYKDFIPNHYVLGYYYSTYLKNKYGVEAMEKMVNRAWALPFIPFTFSFAQQRFGGGKMPATYLAMMDELKEKWSAQQAALTLTPFTKINTAPKKVYTNYNYPQVLADGRILTMKSGLADIEQLVLLIPGTGEEEKVFVPGVVNDAGLLSVQGTKVVWNEITFDPRWRQKTYSVIRTYDIATGEYTELTKGSRYSSASFSPDGTKIATIEETTDYRFRLVVLNAFSGYAMKSFDAPAGSIYLNPVWSGKQHVVLAEVRDGAKQIKEINILTGEEQVLLAPTTEHISYAFRREGYLYYVSGITGIDNIYAKDLTNGKIYRITSSKYGAYTPAISADGKIMYYNELTVLGNDVVSIALTPANWTAVEKVTDTSIRFYQPMVEMEGHADILASVPDSAYAEKRFRKNPVKLHSWGPFIADSPNELEAGLYSTDLLSTTDIFAGFRVDVDGNFKWLGRVSYQNLYPIIDVEVNYANRQARVNYLDTATNDIAIDNQQWQETGLKAGLRIPWLLTRNKYNVNFILQNYVGLTAVRNFQSSVFGQDRYFLYFNRLNDGNLVSNEFRLTFYSLMKRSKRDINAKWGWVFVLENFGTPYGGDFKGGLTALRTQLYVPSFFKHHSLNFFAGYQHINITLDNNNYWFPNRMPYPRGVSGSTFEDFYTFRVNYDLPLLYPDLSLGPWVYLQRVKAKIFYDYGYGRSDIINRNVGLQLQTSRSYYATGAELTFDLNVMRALPQLELGVRFAYLPDLGTTSFEFLLGSFGF